MLFLLLVLVVLVLVVLVVLVLDRPRAPREAGGAEEEGEGEGEEEEEEAVLWPSNVDASSERLRDGGSATLRPLLLRSAIVPGGSGARRLRCSRAPARVGIRARLPRVDAPLPDPRRPPKRPFKLAPTSSISRLAASTAAKVTGRSLSSRILTCSTSRLARSADWAATSTSLRVLSIWRRTGRAAVTRTAQEDPTRRRDVTAAI